jgi:hypothetical protein
MARDAALAAPSGGAAKETQVCRGGLEGLELMRKSLGTDNHHHLPIRGSDAIGL